MQSSICAGAMLLDFIKFFPKDFLRHLQIAIQVLSLDILIHFFIYQVVAFHLPIIFFLAIENQRRASRIDFFPHRCLALHKQEIKFPHSSFLRNPHGKGNAEFFSRYFIHIIKHQGDFLFPPKLVFIKINADSAVSFIRKNCSFPSHFSHRSISRWESGALRPAGGRPADSK